MEENNQKMKKPGNGRELFYVVITIAIFIVMAVGATFAFFTASANSGDQDVATGSTKLSLEFISYGSAWSKNDLIPADRIVSEYSIEYQGDTTLGYNTLLGNTLPNDLGAVDKMNNTLCKDDYGNSVCSIYEFQVRNTANSPQIVNINLTSTDNGFTNLKAMAYEVSVGNATTYNDIANKTTAGNNGYGDPVFKANAEDVTTGAIQVKRGTDDVYDETPVYINRAGVTKTLLTYEASPQDSTPNLSPSVNLAVPTASNGTVTLATNVEIGGNQTKSFIIVLYIANLETDQTADDADRTFTGLVSVSNEDSTEGVSGVISASGTATLQGNTP